MKTIRYHRLGLHFALFLLSTGVFAQQNVGINNPTPHASAVLDIAATNKGLLIPRLTEAQRQAIASPATGLMVFQTDGSVGFWYYVSTGGWTFLNSAGDNLGNHTATQTLNLNNQRLLGTATSALGDSTAQVEIQAHVSNKSAAFITRSEENSRKYTRTILSGYGTGPMGQGIDYAVWGNAYRSGGWGAIFSAGNPVAPTRWVGLAQHPGFTNAGSAIRIVDGTQGVGKVLTSDAEGNGKWASPSQTATQNFNLATFKLVGNGGSRGISISNTGDIYMVEDPANGNNQTLYLPGHLYLSPLNASTPIAYIQARVPVPSASTNIGLTLRTTIAGGVRDALTISPDGSANFYGTVKANNVTLTSDARFKQGVRPVAGALATVQALRGVRYTWNELGIAHGGQANAEQIGFLAQELEKVYPELVTTDAEGYKAVNYAQLTPVLLEAIKELSQKEAALQKQVELLNKQQAVLQIKTDQHSTALQTLQKQMATLLGEAPAGTQARK
ncbi:tail fiber domain-containing protein [Rufibacter sp. LB8]|uniref:tail fiber domain-containing protein n=1 Tax=Rufibacter sp. LB8 TaxID=2777781 RepID=UPI00178C3A35|nr:tail fiber domain-containing protein [Rufibacter sp. LB8]